ncbi:MAG TPA: Crp/Fnr family transcriptional regulator [Candidatus Hydrogenedentes bacterium]|nr:Crp/Fnr family transcriptional regulator [Candidatus Hydrogenedentota bacterium]HOK89289.1 Crp/Fnr family transcriptional regulator [Candidatus Hydrogenedentota bacterium]
MKRISGSLEERMVTLKACALFSELDEGGIRALASRASFRAYDKGEILFHSGETADGMYLVADGLVKVYRLGPDGREQVIHLFGRGEPVGEVAMFEGTSFPASAMALAPCRTLFLPRDAFLRTAREDPDFLMRLLAVLSRRLRRFVDLIEALSLKEVSARLAARLLEMAEESGGKRIRIPGSKATLAAHIGTAPETLSRLLNRFQQEGLIRVEGREIEVLRPDRLRALAESGE